MREIKFRGLDKEGYWKYGSLINDYRLENTKSSHAIRLGNSITIVYPETVGQYTGLKDKNGVEIYEGDKLFCDWSKSSEPTDDPLYVGHVEYHEGVYLLVSEEEESENLYLFDEYEASEVIGNIHQHPELLK